MFNYFSQFISSDLSTVFSVIEGQPVSLVKYRVFMVFRLNQKNKYMMMFYDGIETDSRFK